MVLFIIEYDKFWKCFASVHEHQGCKISADCHRDIADFLEQLNKQKKESAKSASKNNE
jgi:hypothetical protein